MKNLVLTIGTIIAFTAGSTVLISCGPGSQKESDSSVQHDMDMDHDQSGDNDKISLAAIFACPMHPEITGVEGDKCSKCGMELVAASEDQGNGNMEDMDMSAVASCPMHPEITGKEGDTCSKCGMTLVLADASEDNHDHQH
jgi:hypothetical protein